MTMKDDDSKWWPQLLVIFFVSLGGLSTGLLFAWSSPFSVIIANDKVNYDITEEEASYFVILGPIGMVLTTPILFKLIPILGQKLTLWLVAIPHSLSWLVIMFATTKWEFYLSKFLAGVGDALYFSSYPSYVGEITIPIVRGYFGSAPSLSLYVGFFVTTAIGNYLGVKGTAYVLIWCPILYSVLNFFVPESPYRLVALKKFDEAKSSLQWLRRKVNIESDFLALKADVERQMSEEGTYKELFAVKSNRRAMIAALILRVSQQFSGMTIFSTYTQAIFEKAGGNLSSETSSLIFMGVTAILTIACSVSAEKFGRRKMYLLSVMTCSILLLCMSLYFALDQYNIVDLQAVRWIPIVGMLLYVIAFSPGLGVIPQLMTGELFSSSIKSKAMCIILLSFGIAMYASSNLFTILNSNVGLYAPFLMYGLVCLVSTGLTLKWVPETQGKTLEEIQQMLKK